MSATERGIYVYVKDDLGSGVPGVKVLCNKASPDSDTDGFAFFDPLDENTYPTSVDPSGVSDRYYLFSKSPLPVPVSKGRITLVEFQLNRYATLQVGVRRSDKKEVHVKDATLKVETLASSQVREKQEQKSLDTGTVPFGKLRREKHKVTVTLPGEKDKAEYVIDGPSETEADPTINSPVYFEVLPAGVIDFELLEVVAGKRNPFQVSAKLQLEHGGKPIEKEVSSGTAHLDKLEPGRVKVLSVDISKAYEFVELEST